MIDMKKLVIDFGKGDIEGHHFFYRLHHAELYYFAGKAIADNKEGKKLAEQMAIQVWYRDNSTLQSVADIKALYFITLKNICTDHLRYKKDEKYQLYRKRLELLIEPVAKIITAGDAPLIENLYQEVIDKARAILQMAFSKAITEEEIGTQMSMTVGEVTHYLDIARRSVKIILSENL